MLALSDDDTSQLGPKINRFQYAPFFDNFSAKLLYPSTSQANLLHLHSAQSIDCSMTVRRIQREMHERQLASCDITSIRWLQGYA